MGCDTVTGKKKEKKKKHKMEKEEKRQRKQIQRGTQRIGRREGVCVLILSPAVLSPALGH